MEKKYLSKEMIGKEVIDSNALIIGTVKDMSFDLASKNFALVISTKTGVEVVIDSDDITSMNEVVLLNKPMELPPPDQQIQPPSREPQPEKPQPSPLAEPGFCGVCSYQNEVDSNFCIKCGSKLK